MPRTLSLRIAIVVAAVTFVVGLLCGTLAGAYVIAAEISKVFIQSSYDRDAAAIRQHILALTLLRDGQVGKAVEFLDSAVDGDLLAYGILGQTALAPSPTAIRALHEARRYYTRFPHHTGDTGLDDKIQRVLGLVVQEAPHTSDGQPAARH